MIAKLRAFAADETGAALVEFGLVIALLSFPAIAAMAFVATTLQSTFTNIVNSLQSFTTGLPPP